jgi:hypothetical protein
MCDDLPVPALIDGAFRFAGFLSFLGRIVSLLGFSRKLPSVRPEAERSWLPMVDWATDGIVSVSTVMLRRGGWVAERVESEDSDGFDVTWFGRCVEVDCDSCILPFFAALDPLSLPLPVCMPLLSCLELRSSVTLEELTSLRSSSEVLLVVLLEERKLR